MSWATGLGGIAHLGLGPLTPDVSMNSEEHQEEEEPPKPLPPDSPQDPCLASPRAEVTVAYKASALKKPTVTAGGSRWVSLRFFFHTSWLIGNHPIDLDTFSPVPCVNHSLL